MRLAATLRAGDAVVLPTDTVYGLVVLADDPAALDRLRVLKGRPEHVPIAVLVADSAQASTLADRFSPAASALAQQFWPGPLTLVVQAAADAPDVGGAGTIGIRCPADDLLRALVTDVGPLAASSANLHGEPTGTSAATVAGSFGDLLIIDGGERSGLASTVVDCTAEVPVIVREGPLGGDAIRAALPGS